MRGRTNVMQRKEPTINGVVQNFTVFTGNTITKGDFVSCKVQDVIEQQNVFSGLTPKQNALKKFINDYYVYECVDLSNSVCSYFLVNCSGGIVTVIDSVNAISTSTDTKICMFDVYNGKLYILTPNRKILIYSIATTGFTYVGEMTITYTGDYSGTMYNPCMLDDTHLLLSNYYNFKAYIFLMDVDEQNLSVTFNSIPFDYSLGSNAFACYLKRIDSKTCSLADIYNSNSNKYFTVIKFANDFTATVLRQQVFSNSVYPDEWSFSDDGLTFCGYSSSTLYIARYNVTEDRIEVNTLNLLSYFSRNMIIYLTFVYNDKVFLTGFYDNSGQRSVVSVYVDTSIAEVLYNASSEPGTTFSNQTIRELFYDIKNGVVNIPVLMTKAGAENLMWEEIANGEIVIGKITNYVEQYSPTSRNPIGFAKTGGNAGDIIQVYTPPISS